MTIFDNKDFSGKFGVDDFKKLSPKDRDDFRNNPKNFIFNYINKASDGADIVGVWFIGLKIYFEEGKFDDGLSPDWLDEMKFITMGNGIYIQEGYIDGMTDEEIDNLPDDITITNKLIALGLEFEPKYKSDDNW